MPCLNVVDMFLMKREGNLMPHSEQTKSFGFWSLLKKHVLVTLVTKGAFILLDFSLLPKADPRLFFVLSLIPHIYD
jgi:hypothetical protein